MPRTLIPTVSLLFGTTKVAFQADGAFSAWRHLHVVFAFSHGCPSLGSRIADPLKLRLPRVLYQGLDQSEWQAEQAAFGFIWVRHSCGRNRRHN